MNEFRLNITSKNEISNATGVEFEKLIDTDIPSLDAEISKHIDAPIKPATILGGLISRGSVYLLFNRLFSPQFINRHLARIKS